MNWLCDCGKLHYSLDHYFAVHGDHLGVIPEHRTRIALFSDGTPADFSKIKDGEEIPLVEYKWICKHCGNFNTDIGANTHKSNCDFIKYLKMRDTLPYKQVDGFSTEYEETMSGIKPTSKPTEGTAPDPTAPPTFVISESGQRRIANIRKELINIMVSWKEKEPEPERPDDAVLWLEKAPEIKKMVSDAQDKPRGYFQAKLNAIPDKLQQEVELVKSYRTFAQWLASWEDNETDHNVYQPSKARKIEDWYFLGKLSLSNLEKLRNLKKENSETLMLDFKKAYKLDQLLILIPRRKKPKPKPENAPLQRQIDAFEDFYTKTMLYKWSEIDSLPSWFPEPDVDLVGKKQKHWTESNWKDYLNNASDTQDDKGTFTDLQARIKVLKRVFAEAVLDHLIDKKDKNGLEEFIKTYKHEEEIKAVYRRHREMSIHSIINPDPVLELQSSQIDKVLFYDQLFTPQFNQEIKEIIIDNYLDEWQWSKIDDESELKNGILTLRGFPNIKKIVIKINRPYSEAPPIKWVNITTVGKQLEELDISGNRYLTDLFLGAKPNLKKVDARRTQLTRINLSKTKITPYEYDTLNFPIRIPSGAEMIERDKKLTDEQWEERKYRQGTIIYPFSYYLGDETLITLPKYNIVFNEPWIRDNRDWSNINYEFRINPKLVQEWDDAGFDYNATRDWLNIFGNNPEDLKRAKFCQWVKMVKSQQEPKAENKNYADPSWVNDYGDLEALTAEYEEYLKN